MIQQYLIPFILFFVSCPLLVLRRTDLEGQVKLTGKFQHDTLDSSSWNVHPLGIRHRQFPRFDTSFRVSDGKYGKDSLRGNDGEGVLEFPQLRQV